jgi:hypothetical protein
MATRRPQSCGPIHKTDDGEGRVNLSVDGHALISGKIIGRETMFVPGSARVKLPNRW